MEFMPMLAKQNTFILSVKVIFIFVSQTQMHLNHNLENKTYIFLVTQ